MMMDELSFERELLSEYMYNLVVTSMNGHYMKHYIRYRL